MRKRNLLLLWLLILSINSFGQNEQSKVLTDTSLALGIIKEDCFAGIKVGNSCYNQIDKFIQKGTTVIISGIKTCYESNLLKNLNFYEIIHNNKTYFIEDEKIITYSNYYRDLAKMSKEVADSFRSNAKKKGQLYYETKINKAINFLKAKKNNGLVILDWSFYDQSEYTEGTSVKIKVYNPTAKVIKYLWFTFVGINSVGDKITDRKRGQNIVMKGIGPINPEESGTYEYEYVWFTDLVQTVKIQSIKVQYMDGSIKTIGNPKEIILSEDLYELINGE